MMVLHCIKNSKYRVFSGPYFRTFGLNTDIYEQSSVFSLNAKKYGPKKAWYLDTSRSNCIVKMLFMQGFRQFLPRREVSPISVTDQHFSDSQLAQTGTWSRRISVHRISKSAELSVNLISLDYGENYYKCNPYQNKFTLYLNFLHYVSFIQFVRKIFRQTNISHPLIRSRTFAYQVVRNNIFPENFAYLLN